MKHDEKKIGEITREDKRPFGFDADIDQIRWAMEEYAEHMVQQERERIIKILETGMNTKNNYNMKYSDLIKAINQDL